MWESRSFSVRSSARSFGRFTTTPPGRAQPSCRWAERTRRRVFARPVQERGAQREVRDYFVQGRRGWVRLHEKGGKEHEVPCHHNLERYLDEYIAAAGIAEDPDAPLFQTAAGRTGQLTGNALWQQDAYRMIQRRAKAAGIQTRIGNHTFRATGITAYLKNSGTLETAQHIANHESPRTTKLYDRREEEISLDEVERIAI